MAHFRTVKVERMAALFKLLGDPSRVALLLALVKQPQGLYVHEASELLGLTHSATSHQFGVLAAAGLVEHIKEGQSVRYTLAATIAGKRAVRLLRAAERR